jgi:hypothetical protein
MAWVAAAMAGGSALQMGGSIFGGLFGSSAEKKRAAAIQAAGRQGAADIQAAVKGGVAEGNAKLDTARGDLSPFAGYGKQAGDSLMSLLLGGQTPAQLLKASDLFNFQSDLGSRNINRELSARGLYGSGAGLETLQRFNDQLVGEEGQRMFDRLFGVTQLGEGAAGSMADMTNRTGLTLADMIFKGGTAAANLRYDSAVGAAGALECDAELFQSNPGLYSGPDDPHSIPAGGQTGGGVLRCPPQLDSFAQITRPGLHIPQGGSPDRTPPAGSRAEGKSRICSYR